MSDTAGSARIAAVIKGLLAKTVENGATEAEATAAAEKVQELLAKYNLDMAQVDAAGGQSEGRERTKIAGRAMYEYQRELMRTIADINFCFCWLTTTYIRKNTRDGMGKTQKIKGYTVLGRISNVRTTIQMFEYLNSTIERLLPFPQHERVSRSAISWKTGAATRLRSRLYQRRQEMERQSKQEHAERAAASRHPGAAPSNGTSNGNALVLADVYDREYEANYDFAFGEGSLARWRARQADMAAQGETEELEETAEQKAKREKAAERARARWSREQARKEARIDHHAFNAGYTKAGDIGLDPQVQGHGAARLGKE